METINMRNFCFYFIAYKLISYYIAMHWKYKEITNLDCILYENFYLQKISLHSFLLRSI